MIDPNPFSPVLSQIVLTSPDAVNWTVRVQNTGATQPMYSVSWNGSQFVAVGHYDATFGSGAAGVWTSVDGISWVQGTINSLSSVYILTDVIWGGGKFVTIGVKGDIFTGAASYAILTSLNGISWSEQTVPQNSNDPTSTLSHISWNGTQYLAVGSGNTILTSSDAFFWALQDSSLSAQVYFNSIAWNGFQYLLAGGFQGQYFTLDSLDGITWVGSELLIFSDFTDVEWTGTAFVAVGAGGIIATSQDGISWVKRASGTTADLVSVAWSGSLLVAVGNPDLVTGAATVLISLDGVNWTVTPQVPGTNIPLSDIAWGGSQFVALDGANGGVLTSLDGIVWTHRNTGTSVIYISIMWDGAQFIAVGDRDFVSGTASIITSLDGINWTLRDSGLQSGVLMDIAWNGSLYVAMDEVGNTTTSSDGVTWTAHLAGSLAGGSKITSDGSQFVVVGQGGLINTSTDGVAWSPAVSGTTNNLSGVIWGGTQFVAVGSAGIILRSPSVVDSTVALSLNGSVFNAGSSISVTATATAGSPLANADVYITLDIPSGQKLYLQPNGSLKATAVPSYANVPIPDVNRIVFNYSFNGTEPIGSYQWSASLVAPGTLNVIGATSTQPFTFTP